MTITPEAIEAAARARLAAQGYAPSVLPPDALWLAFNKEHEMKCMAAAIAVYESAMEAAGWVRVRKKAAKCKHPNYTVTVADGVFTNECDDCGYVWLTYRTMRPG